LVSRFRFRQYVSAGICQNVIEFSDEI
jgi:hypothetical protein